MMKVLFVVPRFHTNQYQMVKTFQQQKHEVFFHVASLGTTEDYSLLTPVRFDQSKLSLFIERIVGKGGVNRPNYFPNPLRYWKVFKKLKPDVVIIRDPYKYFSLMAAFFALFTRAKIVFYTQEDLSRSRNKKTRLKQKLTMSFFRAAWMSPIPGDDRSQNNWLKHMYHIPLPIPTKPVSLLQKDFPDDGPKILMIGKYHQDRKKHLLFIKAINNLKDKYKFKVTIVGECIREVQKEKFEVIRQVVQELGLSDIIDLKTNVPFSKMEELYTTHHIFVLPAINEQYGVSVTEALGYGLPVICTDTCGARFNIANGENGFVIKSDSLEELTAVMGSLISSKQKILEMSERSFNYVQNHLSGEAFYSKFSRLMNERFRLKQLN